jgi:hypothetical protein
MYLRDGNDHESRIARRRQWRNAILALAGLVLIAGCSVGVKFGTGETEPPATLYIFNLDPPGGNVFIYEQVLKPESFEKFKDFVSGGSAYALKQVAMIGGQRYARISLRPRLIMFRMASAPVSSDVQKNFDYRHPGPPLHLDNFGVNADSGETYYEVVYSRGFSEKLFNYFTAPLLERLGIGILLWEKGQGLGDVRGDTISSEKGRELLARLKPQD